MLAALLIHPAQAMFRARIHLRQLMIAWHAHARCDGWKVNLNMNRSHKSLSMHILQNIKCERYVCMHPENMGSVK